MVIQQNGQNVLMEPLNLSIGVPNIQLVHTIKKTGFCRLAEFLRVYKGSWRHPADFLSEFPAVLAEACRFS